MPRRNLSDALNMLKVVFEFAEKGLTGIGLPGVEPLAGIPLLIIKYYETVKADKATMEDLASSLESLYNAILAPIRDARSQGLAKVPEDLRGRIIALAKKLEDSASRNRLSELTALKGCKRFGRRDEISSAIANVTQDVTRLVRDFQLRGQVTIEMLLRNMPTKYDSLIEGLLQTDARFDASTKEPCHPDTRTTMRRKIHEHILDQAKVFVCLVGSPGTGKSAISKTVAAELNDKENLAASYFFDKRGADGGNTSLKTFVSSIVYQLAHYNPLYRATLGRRLEKDPSLSNATADVQLRKLLLEPILSLPTPVVRWIVLVDALDECGDSDNLKKLVDLLAACTGLRRHVAFFLTSRPESEIMIALEQDAFVGVTAVESMDKVDPASTEQDILMFIQASFEKIHEDRRDASSPPSKRETRRFAVKCRGLFEIAAIRVREIQSERAFQLAKAVRVMLDSLENSPTSPSPLQDEYARILRKAYPAPDTKETPTRRAFFDRAMESYKALVGTLLSLRRPLSIAPLAALVGMDVGDATAALRPLSSVISVPNSQSEPVHFYHATFPEFILSKHEANITGSLFHYLIGSSSSQIALALRCLIIMNKSLRRNICQLPDPYAFVTNIPGLVVRIQDKIPEYLRYACVHWSDHLRRTRLPKGSNPLLWSALNTWCTTNIMFYFEVLGWLDETDSAPPALEKMAAWCKSNSAPGLRTLLADAGKFAQTFSAAISKSPGGVYSSGIPFMPSCELYERYKHLGPTNFTVVRGRLPEWRPAPAASQQNRSAICDVAFSPDGMRIVSGSRDGLVQVWSAVTGALERVLEGHTSSIISICFSPNGERVVTGSYDHTVRVWAVVSGAPEMVLTGHTKSVLSVAFSPDGKRIASGSDDCSVRIWNAVTGALERVLHGHIGLVHSVEFSPDGQHVVSESRDGSVRVWSLRTGEWERDQKRPRPTRRLTLPSNRDDEWLRVNDRETWIPQPNRGRCWSDGRLGIIYSGNSGTVTIYRT